LIETCKKIRIFGFMLRIVQMGVVHVAAIT